MLVSVLSYLFIYILAAFVTVLTDWGLFFIG